MNLKVESDRKLKARLFNQRPPRPGSPQGDAANRIRAEIVAEMERRGLRQ